MRPKRVNGGCRHPRVHVGKAVAAQKQKVEEDDLVGLLGWGSMSSAYADP